MPFKEGIAFFDSGIGGLTVLAECVKRCGNGAFYYYGDNEHAPYGNLSPARIKRYVDDAFEKFLRLKVEGAVVACNTVTALCVEELRRKYSFPIVGAEPAVFSAAKRGGEVFVLVTRATYESERFRNLCQRAEKKYPLATLRPFACDRLAGEIERHLFDTTYDFSPFFPKGTPNTVVLGCTHYIYLREKIGTYYGCDVLDGNEGIAKRLLALLGKENFGNSQPLPTTDVKNEGNVSPQESDPDAFLRLGNSLVFFLGGQKMYNKHVFEQMFANVRK